MGGRLELNSGWKITGYGNNGEIVGPFDGTVPGHVHTDLLRHGWIKDPNWRDQALDSQWVEAFDWVYEIEFEWRSEPAANAVLRFEGLDTLAAITLNGRPVGTAQNMFIPHSFSIQSLLIKGSNHLQVRFESVQKYLRNKDINRYFSCFSEGRVFLRRMQCTFGWDWVHRLVSYGIWRPVYVELKPDVEIEHVHIRTISLDGESAILSWEAALSDRSRDSALRLQLLDPEGRMVWERTEAAVSGHSTGTFPVESPRLWWPAGYGDAALYTFAVSVVSGEGSAAQTRSVAFGIRTVRVEQIRDDRGSTFTVVVNGERIFAKGGNWVPADPFPSSVTAERYDHLLQTLVEGNMNMLRVWGGGTYELPAFWSACDRLGIMVSVDFMMACAEYPEEEEWFLAGMRAEVEHVIKELRNHPSLIFWCGDNELAMNNNAEDSYSGKIVCAGVTRPLCEQLDPDRAFFPTSPYGGRPFNSQDEGDCHYSTWYDAEFILSDMTDYRERIVRGRGRFLSESVVMGAPALSSLLKMMEMSDVVDESAAIWEFRTKDNPYNGLDELTHYRMMEKTAVSLFGESADPLFKVRKLAYIQYEFARLKGEHYRRRKYNTSGLLFWMYNDCWPANGCAMVDFFGVPKAGYYGAKKAFRPLMVSVEDCGSEIAVWLTNDTLADRTGTVSMRTAATDGRQLYFKNLKAFAPRNSSGKMAVMSKEEIGLRPGADDIVVQAIWQPDPGQGEAGSQPDRTIYFEAMPKDLRLSKARLQVTRLSGDGRSGEIEIHSDTFARVVTIEGEWLAEDNYFDMMPGETRTIKYKAISSAAEDSTPDVICWNDWRIEDGTKH